MKHFDVIMEEMCVLVGADWKDINPKESDWFLKYSWDKETQEVFIDWATNYLYNNKEARAEVLTSRVRNKKSIRKAMEEFVNNYGWKVEDKMNKNPFRTMKVEVYQCPECLQWIYSRAQHDMRYCKCGQFGVDGGHYDYKNSENWVGERFVKHLPKRKFVELGVTERELYDDWNTSEDKYGVYK